MKYSNVFVVAICLFLVNVLQAQSNRVDTILQILKNPDDLRVLVCAHRGDWRNTLENSMPGFESCIRAGVDILETDIRQTKDGHLIILHDATLDRTTTGTGKVKDWTLDSIKTLYLKDALNRVTPYKIPTLEEVMLLAKGKMLVYLDKTDDKIPAVLQVLEKTGTLHQAVFMAPFTYPQAKQAFGKYLDKIILIPRIEAEEENPEAFIEAYLQNFKPVAIQLRLPTAETPRLDLIKVIKTNKMRACVTTIHDKWSADRGDDRAFENPETNWGWLIQKGISIFNTDRPISLLEYLHGKNLHK